MPFFGIRVGNESADSHIFGFVKMTEADLGKTIDDNIVLKGKIGYTRFLPTDVGRKYGKLNNEQNVSLKYFPN